VRLKVTLRRPSDEVDLSITADATASVADIARHLAAADPSTTGVVPE
jgi:S-DNA-T family DNA segregation ATPase FtsK/SpoIIIE